MAQGNSPEDLVIASAERVVDHAQTRLRNRNAALGLGALGLFALAGSLGLDAIPYGRAPYRLSEGMIEAGIELGTVVMGVAAAIGGVNEIGFACLRRK